MSRNRRSSSVRRIDYEPVTGLMMVGFESGRTTAYFGVPLETYLRLRFAPAPDLFFRDRIAGRYASNAR